VWRLLVGLVRLRRDVLLDGLAVLGVADDAAEVADKELDEM
jgi:hypothetical protein